MIYREHKSSMTNSIDIRPTRLGIWLILLWGALRHPLMVARLTTAWLIWMFWRSWLPGLLAIALMLAIWIGIFWLIVQTATA